MNSTDYNEARRRAFDRLGVPPDAFKSLSVCVFPHVPTSSPPYALWRIFDLLGIEIKPYNPWARYDLCVCFEDHTFEVIDVEAYFDRCSMLFVSDEMTGEYRREATQVRRFVNSRCKDVSKHRVGKVFEEVFGYPLDVDPRTHAGEMVRKSNINAAHDGKIITGPISEAEYERDRQDYVYSVLVDSITDGFNTDFRLLWFGHLSPICYRKERPASRRFARGAKSNSMVPLESQFTRGEIDDIGRFCRAFGLDYGELDCLRDQGSGKLYIVDANKTPASHFPAMTPDGAVEALTCLGTEFARGFLLDLLDAADSPESGAVHETADDLLGGEVLAGDAASGI